jgi:leucyl-tRNA synthetase
VHAAKSQPGAGRLHRECKQGGTTEAELATQEKKGMPTGPAGHPPAHRRAGRGLGRQLRADELWRRRRDGRAGARRARLRVCPQVRPAHQAGGACGWPEHYDYHQWQDWYADKQRGVTINSDSLQRHAYKEAVHAVAHALAREGPGREEDHLALRDWGMSRQRYWGTPIPIIHCDEHGAVPVPEKDLPVVLPQDCIPDGSGNPLHKHEGFPRRRDLPGVRQAGAARDRHHGHLRGQSWYFMRYCDPTNDEAMVAEGADYWMPMDQYIGGIEHAILHLLYARFWTKVMRDLGLVKVDEPFTKLLTQGMVLNHIYSRKGEKGGIEYFWPHEVEDVP